MKNKEHFETGINSNKNQNNITQEMLDNFNKRVIEILW